MQRPGEIGVVRQLGCGRGIHRGTNGNVQPDNFIDRQDIYKCTHTYIYICIYMIIYIELVQSFSGCSAQPRSRAAIRVACGAKPGVELQEVGVEGPMDHQDQCWTLDQAGPW